MPTFDYVANISIMFTEVPLLHRPRAAADAGFERIECWWPFADAAPDAVEIEAFVGAVGEAEVQLCGLNFFAGDMPGGERGLACRPDRQDELEASVEPLLAIAEVTGCRAFNLLFGQYDDRWTPEHQHRTAVEAIRGAAEQLADIGGTVLLEPLAYPLNGEYPLRTGDDVVTLLTGPFAELDNVRLLFDLFHLGANGADLVTDARRLTEWIGHVQVADHPGRGEPGSGQLPITDCLDALAQSGYRGNVACEYKPTRPTTETLGWLPPGALAD